MKEIITKTAKMRLLITYYKKRYINILFFNLSLFIENKLFSYIIHPGFSFFLQHFSQLCSTFCLHHIHYPYFDLQKEAGIQETQPNTAKQDPIRRC